MTTNESMAEIPTPGEVEELPSAVIKIMLANQDRVRRLFRRWLIIASIVLAGGVSYNSYQSHEANVTVAQIRTSQVANMTTNRCVANQVNNQDADVIRALLFHDANPADYKALKKC
jgi:hypothetical protein